MRNTAKKQAKTIAQEDTKQAQVIDRTSFVLPSDWTDIEKMFLLWKVIKADHTSSRAHYKNDEDDMINSIEWGILQALIIMPIQDARDIYPKLKIMQYCNESHLHDPEEKIVVSRCRGYELEAREVCNQLMDAAQEHYTAVQQLYWDKDKRTKHIDGVESEWKSPLDAE